ncbi:LysM peptidoglycan-binding domain-containing protein [Weissella paramesenteroides]|uniref:LysM peptidoglycan-binding domain-containing protein n=2 Tax=Weissella paramesenteroides TaxID=1249 RepID=UPI002074650A|nr:LysM peptidoglycan-binding domain-containing protein [Weissella paramesenteroides]MCM6766160.1 LysM peptidoglycan-binding domain-containing protein [Weissella paramesenteroides]MCM6767536.1 LysM peptidoglycan-binding domain-containing protein [Weissella paramesenteroides]MCM6770251.1 LysM peptidoglycan-binding domain-containing protein [Weissella paramesenteroides]MCM6780174.1 LysM peptidoglycan-binding domain-containing protein [Weissella paramesenteroides]MCM6781255.1 LysM peptidoglycan-b
MHASVKNTLLATAGAAAALAGSSVVASADSITVKSGDTLYALAAAHHVTVDELVSANKIANANLILTGQKIELPGSSATSAQSTASSAATKPAAKGTSYTVKSGDTLWAIANANGLTLSELLSANQGLQASSIIYVGDSINLTASATQASSAPVASSAAATSTANASLAAASSAAAQSAATSAANASLAAASSAAAQSAATSLAAANSAAAQSAATSAANASLAAASSAAAQSAATSAANASLAAANSAAAQSAATSAANASLAAANSAAAQSAATSAANASLAAASSAAAQSAATSAANASLAAASSAAAQSAATSAANASLAAASSAAAQPQKVATSTASNNVVSADTTGNTYPYGQCTWYVKGDLSWVGNHWGNASAWPSSATAAGHTVNSTASVGAVAYFAPGVGGASAYGHVAVVDSVNSDGTITISEANYAGKLYNSRTISLSSVSGFIHQ